MILKRAQPVDAPALADLVNSAYRGESSRVGWTTEEGLLDGQRVDAPMLTDLMTRSGSQVHGLVEDGRWVACFHLELEGDRAFVGMLTVDPELQNRGCGRRLLEEAEEIARREWNPRSLAMSVINLRAELLAYYERRGFRPTGESKKFPFDNPRFGIAKRHDFELITVEKPLSPSEISKRS